MYLELVACDAVSTSNEQSSVQREHFRGLCYFLFLLLGSCGEDSKRKMNIFVDNRNVSGKNNKKTPII